MTKYQGGFMGVPRPTPEWVRRAEMSRRFDALVEIDLVEDHIGDLCFRARPVEDAPSLWLVVAKPKWYIPYAMRCEGP